MRDMLIAAGGLVVLLLAACGGNGEEGTPATAAGATSTQVGAPSPTAEEGALGTPGAEAPTPQAAATPIGDPAPATGGTEVDRAVAAAAQVFGSPAKRQCARTPDEGSCAGLASSPETVEAGIANFSIGDYFGGAHCFLARTPEGEWKFWFGCVQDVTYQLTFLPGEMQVCADGAGLNLRASYSDDSEALGLLSDGTTVSVESFVLAEPGSYQPPRRPGYGWYRVVRPQEGWAYSRYLSNAALDDPCSWREIQLEWEY